MKLQCKGEYHNGPVGLHFDGPKVIEVNEIQGLFLLRDAPENFERIADEPGELPTGKALDAPPADKAVKTPPKKK